MSRPKSLNAVFTSAEANEQEALREEKRIAQIVDAREDGVRVLKNKCAELKRTLVECAANQQRPALLRGDTDTLHSTASYLERLRKEIAVAETDLIEREKELAKAQERLQEAEEELTKARIEKKQVEKLLAQAEQTQRILKEARDEVQSEEAITTKHRK